MRKLCNVWEFKKKKNKKKAYTSNLGAKSAEIYKLNPCFNENAYLIYEVQHDRCKSHKKTGKREEDDVRFTNYNQIILNEKEEKAKIKKRETKYGEFGARSRLN